MLDGAPCPDARARRAHHEGRARLDLGDHFWAGTALMLDGAAQHVDARPWGGGVRRAGARPCVSARGVPRITIPKELSEECLRGGSAPTNGSRLSCGHSARGRKELEPQTKSLASEATQFLPTCERPAASSAC